MLSSVVCTVYCIVSCAVTSLDGVGGNPWYLGEGIKTFLSLTLI